jgi:glyoxylase-like metal-dependent hydrolase (beta-lactamase superfamily II)
MAVVATFTFNPFQENTYVVYDDSGACVVIDPGCHSPAEKRELEEFITDRKLKPTLLLNTHCHVDHVLGNKFVVDTYAVPLQMHRNDLALLKKAPEVGKTYGVFIEESPAPTAFLDEGSTVSFGETTLSVYFTPGHSPGSICFHSEADNFIVVGDVLFKEGIGRFDFPTSNRDDLFRSLQRLLTLPDSCLVYSGHGPKTTIGHERRHNPFLS